MKIEKATFKCLYKLQVKIQLSNCIVEGLLNQIFKSKNLKKVAKVKQHLKYCTLKGIFAIITRL